MNLTEILEQIERETKMTRDWESPDYLSNLLLRLASYYATLGKFIAEAEQNQLFAEAYYKLGVEKTKVEQIEEGDSVALAESKAALSAEEAKQEYINLKYKARLLFLARQSLEKSMDAIRSKLSYLKTERESVRDSG